MSDFGELRSACHQQGLGGLFRWLARVDRDKPLADGVWQYIKDTKNIEMPDCLHRQYIYIMHRMELDVCGAIDALVSISLHQLHQGWHSPVYERDALNRWLMKFCLPMMVNRQGDKVRFKQEHPRISSLSIPPKREYCSMLKDCGFEDVVSVAGGLMPDPRAHDHLMGQFAEASVNKKGDFVLYDCDSHDLIKFEWTPESSHKLLDVCLRGLSCDGFVQFYHHALYTAFYIHHKQMQRLEANQ